MKFILSAFLTMVFSLQILNLESSPCERTLSETCTQPCFEECPSDHRFTLVPKVGAFFPLDSNMREIYGTALPSFTLEGNFNAFDCWSLWLDVSYIFGEGHSDGGGHFSTHLNLVPISLGIKYIFKIDESLSTYLGFGPCYSFLNTKDHSPYVHEKTSVNNSGAILKSGVTYQYSPCLSFEAFFNYMYQKFYFHKKSYDPFVYRNDVNLSNLQLGAGVSWAF